MFRLLICLDFRVTSRANTHEAGDLRRNRARYDVILMAVNELLGSSSALSYNMTEVMRCCLGRIHILIGDYSSGNYDHGFRRYDALLNKSAVAFGNCSSLR